MISRGLLSTIPTSPCILKKVASACKRMRVFISLGKIRSKCDLSRRRYSIIKLKIAGFRSMKYVYMLSVLYGLIGASLSTILASTEFGSLCSVGTLVSKRLPPTFRTILLLCCVAILSNSQ